MKESHLTRQERDMILWLRILAGFFAFVGLVLAIRPKTLPQYVNDFGYLFFDFQSPSFENSPNEMGWVLSLSLFGCLAYSCFLAGRDWLRFHLLVPIIIIAKAIAAVGFLGLVIFQPTTFFYIVACLVDGIICLVTFYAYTAALKSRSF